MCAIHPTITFIRCIQLYMARIIIASHVLKCKNRRLSDSRGDFVVPYAHKVIKQRRAFSTRAVRRRHGVSGGAPVNFGRLKFW